MIIINSNFNDAVKEEEKKLLESYELRKKFLDIENDIRDARKAANKALNTGDKQAYELAKAQMDELAKKSETMKSTAHKLAIKRAADLRRKEEDDLRALQKRRSESEKLLNDARKKYAKAKTDDEKVSALQEIENAKKLNDYIKQQIKDNKILSDIDKKRAESMNKIKDSAQKEYNVSKSLMKGGLSSKIGGAHQYASAKTSEYASLRKQKEAEMKELGERGGLDKETLSNYNKEMNTLKAKELGWSVLSNAMEQVGKALGNMANKMNDAVNTAIEDAVSHRTGVMARLQGLGGADEYDFNGLLDKVSSNLATSPYIKQQDFMKKLDEVVDKGIAYNVEQRTFLATVSDKIATTFDAFDSNLMRLIRLQQADSTAARLGMEASLTKTLNSIFSDTSYLSDMYDQVSAAILDSESIMSRDDAAEYEYVVQKWLGSLYSLGVSNNTINQIAQGLNYIGTGNVSALAGNSPLQTLFAMSASRSNGLNYADLLTGGLTAEKTNELLKSMVEYLQEIAENSGNNVVKSAYGDIYQMSLADMRAVSSLTSNDINSIYAQNLSYSSMGDVLTEQFNSISKRMSTGEMMSNVIDNFVYTIGSDIASSAVSYVMWEITDLIQSATGGINLPAISVFGNMVDLSAFTVEGLIKTGIVGMNVLSSIGTILGSFGKSGGLDMGIWGGQEYLTRGKAETTTNGWTKTTSGSAYVGSSSASDMKNSSIAGATEDAEEVSDITNANNKTEHTFDEFFEEVLINGWPIYTKSVGDYDVSDLYSKMYIDKTPTPVTMSTSDGIGAAIALMAMNSNKVSDVNIKSADVILNTSMVGFESKFKESIKQYLKTEFVEVLAEEIRRTVIGSNSGDVNTIAKVCQKVLNDSVDVVIKNNNFDNALDRYYMMGI